MFRNSIPNKQNSIFDASKWMHPKIMRELEKSWAPAMYEHVLLKIDEEKFAVLYDEANGAPNKPVRKLLTLELIQHVENVSDDALWSMYLFDYRVSYALGQFALGEEAMSERTRYNFRERLYLHSMEHPGEEDLIFRQFVELLAEFNKVIGADMTAQRIDSTMFMSNIKKSGRISLAYDVLKRSASKIPEERRTELVERVLSPDFKKETVKSAKADNAVSKLTQLLRCCRDMLALLSGMPDVDAVDEMRLLKRLLDEQAETDESGRLDAKSNKEISPKSMQSAFDEDATYRNKGGKKQSGYVATVIETCSKDNEVQLITGYSVEPNVVSDTAVLNDKIDYISGTGCKELFADGGYASVKVVEDADALGVEMKFTALKGRPSDGLLYVDDFVLNDSRDAVLFCPAGKAPIDGNVTEKSIIAHFDKAACLGCPMWNDCPVHERKNTNAAVFSKESIAAALQRVKCDANRVENTGMRAAIEGSISSLKRKGMDKLRVRGQARCRVVCGFKIIAQNFKRLVNFKNGFYKKTAVASLC